MSEEGRELVTRTLLSKAIRGTPLSPLECLGAINRPERLGFEGVGLSQFRLVIISNRSVSYNWR